MQGLTADQLWSDLYGSLVSSATSEQGAEEAPSAPSPTVNLPGSAGISEAVNSNVLRGTTLSPAEATADKGAAAAVRCSQMAWAAPACLPIGLPVPRSATESLGLQSTAT